MNEGQFGVNCSDMNRSGVGYDNGGQVDGVVNGGFGVDRVEN